MVNKVHVNQLSDDELAVATASLLMELLNRRQRDELSLDLDLQNAAPLFVTVARGPAAHSLRDELRSGVMHLIRSPSTMAH